MGNWTTERLGNLLKVTAKHVIGRIWTQASGSSVHTVVCSLVCTGDLVGSKWGNIGGDIQLRGFCYDVNEVESRVESV